MKNFCVVRVEPYKIVEFHDDPVVAMKRCDELHNKDLKAGIFTRYFMRCTCTGEWFTSYGDSVNEVFED